jgi:hypothetical protein
VLLERAGVMVALPGRDLTSLRFSQLGIGGGEKHNADVHSESYS